MYVYFNHPLGEMIVTSGKYHVQESSQSMYETKMSMIVRKFQKDDVGSYRCIAKNSLGEVDSSIRLYGELFSSFPINVVHICGAYSKGKQVK